MKKVLKKVAIKSLKTAINSKVAKAKESSLKAVKTSASAISKVATHPTTKKVAIQISIVVVAKLISTYIDSKRSQYLLTEKYVNNVS